jgi:tetratricopeptide (TPR) repeat protein
MKQFVLLLILLTFYGMGFSQTLTAKQLKENAQILMQQGDFDNAIAALQKARQQVPLGMELLKNLSFVYYLQRDFSRAIETGKMVTDMDSADEQSYQILGYSYKAIAAYKEANKIYRAALKKFSNSGVIYNELGENFALEKNYREAIIQWEKGIQLSPNISGNYYNAVKYYAEQKNWIRVLLYGELFVNLESYSERTTLVKTYLLAAYAGILNPDKATAAIDPATSTAFEKQVFLLFSKNKALAANGLSADNIGSIRTRFILHWQTGLSATYPYRLFDHWQYLINEGIFEAYNQWIFEEALNKDAYGCWKINHSAESLKFEQFQQSRVFKISAGQYYTQ